MAMGEIGAKAACLTLSLKKGEGMARVGRERRWTGV